MDDDTTDDGPSKHGRPLPPESGQFKPGQSGNPAGRPKNVGQTIVEAMNELGAAGLCPDELRAIVKNRRSSVVRIAAARELLMMAEAGDLADFEDVMSGRETLKDARQRGVNTEVIKKIKRKSKRVDCVGGANDGESVELEVECDIELRDRAGEHVDRVMDRTNGKPTQAVQVTATVDTSHLPTVTAALLTDPDVLDAALALQSLMRGASGSGQLPDPAREG